MKIVLLSLAALLLALLPALATGADAGAVPAPCDAVPLHALLGVDASAIRCGECTNGSWQGTYLTLNLSRLCVRCLPLTDDMLLP